MHWLVPDSFPRKKQIQCLANKGEDKLVLKGLTHGGCLTPAGLGLPPRISDHMQRTCTLVVLAEQTKPKSKSFSVCSLLSTTVTSTVHTPNNDLAKDRGWWRENHGAFWIHWLPSLKLGKKQKATSGSSEGRAEGQVTSREPVTFPWQASISAWALLINVLPFSLSFYYVFTQDKISVPVPVKQERASMTLNGSNERNETIPGLWFL